MPSAARSDSEGLSIEELIFKGTHNSYACRGRHVPSMNHPLGTQIDDFGVWTLELDVGAALEDGVAVPMVGHHRPGDRACWGHRLADHVESILRAKALEFRPVFVYIEVKTWQRSRVRPWRRPPDLGLGFEEKWQAARGAFEALCADRLVILEDWLRGHDDHWPTPTELAGKVVLYEPNSLDTDGRPVGLRGTHADRCVTPTMVETAIETGRPLVRNGSHCPGGARAMRLDQYQADWTFAYGVPPNPLVVDPRAPGRSGVSAEGSAWRCGDDRSHGQVVSDQGTYRFPYRSLSQAVERAQGITSATDGRADSRRAGHGWTVLVRAVDDAIERELAPPAQHPRRDSHHAVGGR